MDVLKEVMYCIVCKVLTVLVIDLKAAGRLQILHGARFLPAWKLCKCSPHTY